MSGNSMLRSAILCLCCFALVATSAPQKPAAVKMVPPEAVVSEQLKSTDLLNAKIAFDRIVDPSTRPADVQLEVDKLIAAARTFAGPHPSVGGQLDAVRKVLHEPGPWNDNRPFAYDRSDPLGEKVRHKLLSEYLKTRLGNCVTMPTLFMIVGRGVGLHLTLTDGPLHMLVRFTHGGLPALNVEATSGGGFARDEWYRQKLPMSKKAFDDAEALGWEDTEI